MQNVMALTRYLEELFGRNVDLISEKWPSPYLQPYIEAEVVEICVSKEIAVCTGSGQGKDENILIYPVDQEPVRLNMTFTKLRPHPVESVVSVVFWKAFTPCKDLDNLLQECNIVSSFLQKFYIFFEPAGCFYFVHASVQQIPHETGHIFVSFNGRVPCNVPCLFHCLHSFIVWPLHR